MAPFIYSDFFEMGVLNIEERSLQRIHQYPVHILMKCGASAYVPE